MSDTRKELWASVGIALAVFLVYANTINAPMIFDDPLLIPEISATPLVKLLSYEYGLRILYNVSLRCCHLMGGGGFWMQHLASIALHAFNAVLLFSILLRTLRLPSAARLFPQGIVLPAAFVCAAAWALHPLQTESVAYVSQRSEVMVGTFLFAALYALLRADAASGVFVGRLWQIAAVAACLLGFISKEAMISAPFLIALYDRAFLARTWGESVRRHALFYVLLLGTAALPAAALAARGSLMGYVMIFTGEGDVAFVQYFLTGCGVLLHYVRLALFPVGQCFDYAWPFVDGWTQAAPTALCVAALLSLTICLSTKSMAMAYPFLWMFVALAPRTLLVPGPEAAVEHRMYLPLAGLLALPLLLIPAIAVWRGISPASRPGRGGLERARVAAGLAAAVLVFLGAATLQRNELYRTPLLLWNDTVEKAPGNPRARNYYGIALHQNGRQDEALEQFMLALAVNSSDPLALNNIGNIHAERDEYAKALVFYERSLANRDPQIPSHRTRIRNEADATTLENMALMHERMGDHAAAASCRERMDKLRR